MEGVREPVGRYVPALGDAGHDADPVAGVCHQPLEQRREDLLGVARYVRVRVEVRGFGFVGNVKDPVAVARFDPAAPLATG